jgi:N-acetylglucosaminyldiphosphoundecaprenol N-acetyl-beta-D-mannosaminyltransferase
MGELGGISAIQREYEWPTSKSISLFGFRVDTFSDKDVVDLASHAINAQKRYILGHHNFHSLYLCHREPRMLDFYSIADHILIDGMSLVLLGRLFSLPLSRRNRATSLDFMPLLLPEAVKHEWRIYYLGSQPGVAERGAARLRNEYPGLQIRTHQGYFAPDKSGIENRDVLADIKSYAPHILFVGMGMPRQELWVLENREDIEAAVTFVCGAYIDYIAGEISHTPRWLALFYLEWLYRLLSEPRRLSRRYLLEPWVVVSHILRQQFRNWRDKTSVDGSIPGRHVE